jgi:hypothetical protein
MKIYSSDRAIAYLALISGLTISAVAVWYSVAGLVAIFAAAAIPIIIMGVTLEISKLVATVWLKMNWHRAPVLMRGYLLTAIAVLMLITSMGIFGFLSKAHLDQAVPTGDIAAKVAIIDEKIKTERDNIEAARKALTQMDATVDQTIARSSDEKGADKAVALRRSQQRERTALQNEIAAAQKKIAVFNEERAPIAKDLRAVEAEVGPIKYIASLIYGENPDANVLEKAVTWVIIIIVFVFDPLAVILLLASQYSFAWFRKEEETLEITDTEPAPEETEIEPEEDPTNNQFRPTATPYWPFPSSAYIPATWGTTPIHTQEVPSETPLTALGGDITATEEKPVETVEDLPLEQWNKMIEGAEKAVEEEREKEDHEILETATISEKAAMTAWKHDHPDSSLKLQRKMLERGIIDHLPWEDYLKPQADFLEMTDREVAEEAVRWAAEKLEERPGDYLSDAESKKNEIAWMENKDGHQIKKTLDGYEQNAEQSERTIWQRIQDAKK